MTRQHLVCLFILLVQHHVQKTRACGGVYTSPSGSISSPLYPSQYPPNEDCTYIINTTQGYRITLTFVTFDIEAATDDCDFDSLEIWDGSSELSPSMGIFCNTNVPDKVRSTSNTMWIRFQSGSESGTGFYATYSSGDGGWSEWCEWGSCSVTCGEGTRTRRRQCDSPTPKTNGRTCQGLASESTPCSEPACCIDGNWADWSLFSCSVTCGRGTVDRYRTCNNPAPNYCGQTCPGPSRDMRTCEVDDCCVDGEWSSWLLWSTCSATCGSNTQSRMRRCDSPSPNFCGRRCPGPASEARTCVSKGKCCVDGNWAEWSPWSSCPVTCGRGTVDRYRTCSNPAPNYCGQTCTGPSRDMRVCELQSSVDGQWSEWGRWTSCSATCEKGTRERTRFCDNPAPNVCARTCSGPKVKRATCDTGIPCPPPCVDGNWGQWERWGACSATCGQGSRERRRQCDSPVPNFCGQTCPGYGVDRDTCDTRVPCPPDCLDGNWGLWGTWSACPVTFGQALRERRRQCDSPAPNFCGQTCPGLSFERIQYRCGPDEAPTSPAPANNHTIRGESTDSNGDKTLNIILVGIIVALVVTAVIATLVVVIRKKKARTSQHRQQPVTRPPIHPPIRLSLLSMTVITVASGNH